MLTRPFQRLVLDSSDPGSSHWTNDAKMLRPSLQTAVTVILIFLLSAILQSRYQTVASPAHQGLGLVPE